MTVQLQGLEGSFETNIESTAKNTSVLDVSSGSIKDHLTTLSVRDFDGLDDSEGMLDFEIGLQRNEAGRVEVEHVEAAPVPLSWLNRLQQTRQQYEPEKIVDLAKAIVVKKPDGTKTLKLLNPLQVVVLTDEELPIYLGDHEDFYGKKTDPNSLAQGDDGLWYIVDAGHRRSLAIEYLCLKEGIDPEDIDVPCAPLFGISFEEALSYQSRENEYDRPPVVDEAEQIARYFRFLQKRQKKMPTYRQIAEALGVKEGKVSNAMRFDELPNEVQGEVRSGNVTWTNGIHLHQLMRHLNTHYTEKYKVVYADPASNRTLERDVNDGLMTVIKKLRSKELDKASAKAKTDYINAKINAIRNSLGQVELFHLDYEETPSERRQRAETALARKAISVTRSHVGNMVINTQTMAELQELRDEIDQVIARQRVPEAEKDDAMFGFGELEGSVA